MKLLLLGIFIILSCITAKADTDINEIITTIDSVKSKTKSIKITYSRFPKNTEPTHKSFCIHSGEKFLTHNNIKNSTNIDPDTIWDGNHTYLGDIFRDPIEITRDNSFSHTNLSPIGTAYMIQQEWLSDFIRQSQVVHQASRTDPVLGEVVQLKLERNHFYKYVELDLVKNFNYAAARTKIISEENKLIHVSHCSDFKSSFNIFVPSKTIFESFGETYETKIHSIEKIPANILDFKLKKGDRIYDNNADTIIRFDDDGNPLTDDPHNGPERFRRWIRGGAAILSSMTLALLISTYLVRRRRVG
jgi:hypothetical protein